jgi:uncharacterized protein YhaN
LGTKTPLQRIESLEARAKELEEKAAGADQLRTELESTTKARDEAAARGSELDAKVRTYRLCRHAAMINE